MMTKWVRLSLFAAICGLGMHAGSGSAFAQGFGNGGRGGGRPGGGAARPAPAARPSPGPSARPAPPARPGPSPMARPNPAPTPRPNPGQARPGGGAGNGPANRPTTLPGNARPGQGGGGVPNRPTTLPGNTLPGNRPGQGGAGALNRPTTLPGNTLPGNRPGGGLPGDRPGQGGSGTLNRPTTLPGDIGSGNRPGQNNRPDWANRPGQGGSGTLNRPGQGGDFNRPGQNNRPDWANRPGQGGSGTLNRPTTLPGDIGSGNRPGQNNRPDWANRPGQGGSGTLNRPGQGNYPDWAYRPGQGGSGTWRPNPNLRPSGNTNLNNFNFNNVNNSTNIRGWSNSSLAYRGNMLRDNYYANNNWNRGFYYNHFNPWWGGGWYGGGGFWAGLGLGSLASFCGTTFIPMPYNYGTNVIYQGDTVYINGDSVGTQAEYYQQAVDLASVGKQANPPKEAEWQQLGVYAMAKDKDSESTNTLQLAMSKDGTLRGNMYNSISDTTVPVTGKVDLKTQRAVWSVGDNKKVVYEAGLQNLTQDQTPILVHYDSKRTDQMLLVRLEEPEGYRDPNENE